MGHPLCSFLKIHKHRARQLSPLKRRGEIDSVVILALYDVKHMFKVNTDVQTLCFCANAAFEVLFFNPESYKRRDRFMTRFIGILRDKDFYKYLKNNGVEE